jgi:hypothetical protein
MKGLENVKDDQNEVASTSDSNNGLTTTLTILSSLNNTRKILKRVKINASLDEISPGSNLHSGNKSSKRFHLKRDQDFLEDG